ncbi:NAD(P)/FAD-dependent oxidoreductase [Thalassoroseus pseudoceratinae]|uniref:NAD(P)/FAD-dependent oxidoreductase n=1 Tax=Thalassoroseus pseudoceratinae TaxID=2713176 RepID=UPI00142243C4|nr:NAD(P)/FAD-dependent oxidoreductase [Thalassoroseus pseudoceratinae]
MMLPTEVSRREAITLIASTLGLLITDVKVDAEELNMPVPKFDYDVVIVGGGPSGLSAALVLGRSCRKVLVCDEGTPRNHKSHAVHGYFSRDGISPEGLLKIGREQLKPYAVEWRGVRVTNAEKLDDGFRVDIGDGKSVVARKLILATGVKDKLPEIDGLPKLWGTSVRHCPYCHGWEVRGKPWAFLDRGEQAVDWGLELLGWTPNLTLCSNGPAGLSDAGHRILKDRNIEVREQKIERLESNDGALNAIVFESGRRLEVGVLFVRTVTTQRSPLPKSLGCKLESVDGALIDSVPTDMFGATSITGLYVIGDASRGASQVTTAVSEGSMAAVMVNKTLIREDAERT